MREMMDYLSLYGMYEKILMSEPSQRELPLVIGNVTYTQVDYILNYLCNENSMRKSITNTIYSGGKGFSSFKIIASSLGESFERLLGVFEYFGMKDDFLFGSYDELSKNKNLLSPAEIRLFHEKQFEEKNFLYQQFTDQSCVGWIRGKRFFSDKEIWVPVQLILLYYRLRPEEARIGYSTSGGLTFHYDFTSAFCHGITELLERDAVNICWYTHTKPKEIIYELEHVSDKNKTIFKYAKQNGIRFYYQNIDHHTVHVVTAIKIDKSLNRYSYLAGGGVGFTLESAMENALYEYAQSENNLRNILYNPNSMSAFNMRRVLDAEADDDPQSYDIFYKIVSYYGLIENRGRLDWYTEDCDKIQLKDYPRTEHIDKYSDLVKFLKINNIDPIVFNLTPKGLKKNLLLKVFVPELSPAFIVKTPFFGHPNYYKHISSYEDLYPDPLPYP